MRLGNTVNAGSLLSTDERSLLQACSLDYYASACVTCSHRLGYSMKRLNPKTQKPFRNGDVREDGYIFRRYNLSRKRPNGEFLEQWYSPDRYRHGQERDKQYMLERSAILRDKLRAYKLEKGCIDCGYKAHSAALDFDHLPGSNKEFGIGKAVAWSDKRVWAEVAKCEVVCANCHRIRTNERGANFTTRPGQPSPSLLQPSMA